MFPSQNCLKRLPLLYHSCRNWGPSNHMSQEPHMSFACSRLVSTLWRPNDSCKYSISSRELQLPLLMRRARHTIAAQTKPRNRMSSERDRKSGIAGLKAPSKNCEPRASASRAALSQHARTFIAQPVLVGSRQIDRKPPIRGAMTTDQSLPR